MCLKPAVRGDDAIFGGQRIVSHFRQIFFHNHLLPQFARMFHRPDVAGRMDSRAARVALLLTAVVILNAIDLVYTLFAHSIGQLNEMNPLADTLLNMDLQPSLICFKILMVGGGAILLWKLRDAKLALPACWVLLAAFTILGVMWCAWVFDIITILDLRATFGFTDMP
jgi:hypothetical protein